MCHGELVLSKLIWVLGWVMGVIGDGIEVAMVFVSMLSFGCFVFWIWKVLSDCLFGYIMVGFLGL